MNELIDLWVETKIRCDRIEHLVKQLKEESEKINDGWFFKERNVI